MTVDLHELLHGTESRNENGFYSVSTDAGDDVSVSFPFSFVGEGVGYLRESDIHVFERDSDPDSETYNELTEIIEDFEFPSPNTITLTTVVGTPVDGENNIYIRRIMPKDSPYADASTGAIFRKDTLNNSVLQSLYLVHEALDGYLGEDNVIVQIADLYTKVAGLEEYSNTTFYKLAGDILQGDMDTDGNRILNLPKPITGSEPARLQDVPLINGETITVPSVKERITLTDGQTVVTFTEYETTGADFSISGDNVDNGTLPESAYTITSDTSITLTDSYPAGTIVTLALNTAHGEVADASLLDVNQTSDIDDVAAYKALLVTLPVGKRIYLKDRQAYFEVISGTGTANTFNIVASDQVDQSIQLTHNGTITPEAWGISDSTSSITDDSEGIQAIFDDPTVNRVQGDPTKTYAFKLIETDRVKLTWDGGNFKFIRTLTEINTYTWDENYGGASNSTGNEWLIRITKPPLAESNGVVFKNITVDGSALTYSVSAGHPNLFIQLFHIKETKGVLFKNVDISEINGNGILVANSEDVHISGGSVTMSAAIQSSPYSNEQIALIGSANCSINNVTVGGTSADSAIATVGGLSDVIGGTEVGGFIPFNSPDGVYNGFSWFGIPCGATDSFHSITNNIVKSDYADPAQDYNNFGGGMPGRVVTINSGSCVVKGNVVYDTLGVAQAGIGLGHDEVSLAGGLPPYGFMASRAEVSGNTIFGFTRADAGHGISNNGSEDCNVHDNYIYNNVVAVIHNRYATTSRYCNNWIFYNDTSFYLQPIAGSASSHGIVSRVQMKGNNCWNNLQDIAVEGTSTWADLEVKGNIFEQVRSNALRQFDIYHGVLDWADNEITNNSSNQVGHFFARDTNSHCDINDTTVECLQDIDAELFLIDGDTSPTNGRGRLAINALTADCPTGSNNRKVRVRRANTKDVSIYGLHFTNALLHIDGSIGDVTVDGGIIQTQGTGYGILLTVSDSSLVTVSNINFPAVGSTTPINAAVSVGHLVVNSCTTKEDKEVTDEANSNNVRNNNCWKVTSGVLTQSRP